MKPVLVALIFLNLLFFFCGCTAHCPRGYFAMGYNPRTGDLICGSDSVTITSDDGMRWM